MNGPCYFRQQQVRNGIQEQKYWQRHERTHQPKSHVTASVCHRHASSEQRHKHHSQQQLFQAEFHGELPIKPLPSYVAVTLRPGCESFNRSDIRLPGQPIVRIIPNIEQIFALARLSDY
jgi:hypothetical protein